MMRNAFKHYFNKSSFLLIWLHILKLYFERIIILFRMFINNWKQYFCNCTILQLCSIVFTARKQLTRSVRAHKRQLICWTKKWKFAYTSLLAKWGIYILMDGKVKNVRDNAYILFISYAPIKWPIKSFQWFCGRIKRSEVEWCFCLMPQIILALVY